jgi:hypothetical protein
LAILVRDKKKKKNFRAFGFKLLFFSGFSFLLWFIFSLYRTFFYFGPSC